MRIISKLRDYYDSVQSLGQDQSIVYLREPKEIETRKHYHYPQSFTACTIGFCGNVYAVMHAQFGEREGWCYSPEDCDRFVESLDQGWERERYFDVPKGRRRYRSRFSKWPSSYSSYTTQMGIKSYFGGWSPKAHYLTKIFQDHNVPIFVWEPARTVINPLLRPYEFFRVKDPYMAFQELQGYVGGVLLAKVNPVPDIPDEIMQEIKGFDHKYSFRKEPKGA